MKVLLTSSREELHLEEVPFAQGGEGALYTVLKPVKYQHCVAKLYHPKKRTRQRANKLHYLVQHPPVFEDEAQENLVSWPLGLLEQRKRFIGFLMPRAIGRSLEILATAKMPNYLPQRWQRFALGSTGALELRQKVCFNIAVALYHIHKTGRYIMVDFKPDNILIQENGLVSLVDMDSIEIVNGQQVLFPAAVTTPEYAPPEYHLLKQRKEALDVSWDTFSMAIIFYKILLGIHPFAATTQGAYETVVGLGDKLKHGLYVHNQELKHHFSVIPLPHLEFYNFPRALQYLFSACFVQGLEQPELRPKAEDWCMALGTAQQKNIEAAYVCPSALLEWKGEKLGNKNYPVLEQAFKPFFENRLSAHQPKFIAYLQQSYETAQRQSWKLWTAVIGIFVGMGVIFYTYLGVVLLALSLTIIGQYFKQINWAKIPMEGNLPVLLNDLYQQKYSLLEQKYKALEEEQQQLIKSHQAAIEGFKKRWETKNKRFQEKCRQLSETKQIKFFRLDKELFQHPAWMRFVGKSAAQKQRYIQRKFLPLQLQQISQEYEQKNKQIDKEHQRSWRNLEAAYYQKLETIDAQKHPNRVELKELAETTFVQKRQEIIEAIQKEKNAAKNYCEQQQDLAKKTAKNYCNQLEALEDNWMNKRMAVEANLDKKYQQLLDENALQNERCYQNVGNENARFILDNKNLILSLDELLESMHLK